METAYIFCGAEIEALCTIYMSSGIQSLYYEITKNNLYVVHLRYVRSQYHNC
jgi:hypothetical protein